MRVTNKVKIEDAGEKLWGARKDLAPTISDSGDWQEPLLEVLWPKPEQWTSLIPALGARQAALAMVVYENLAKRPHRHGWLGSNGAHWERAYRFGIRTLRELCLQAGAGDLDTLREAYKSRMRELSLQLPTPSDSADFWGYAVGKAGTRTNRHPLTFTPIDGLRAKYLSEWGWGTDPRVGNQFSMGALSLESKATRQLYWRAVKGVSGGWEYIDDRKFASEREALSCTREKVLALLAEQPTARAKRTKDEYKWIRPSVSGTGFRGGFASTNSSGRSQYDLMNTFGFRAVEFGNWVTQSERQQFVDAAYDAFQDLAFLLGAPPMFVSLGGKLALAYGSRGQGLSKAVAHFEPGSWILHFTKESGPGSLSHEFGHAVDAWAADHLWGQARWRARFASADSAWGIRTDGTEASDIAKAVVNWQRFTFTGYSKLAWVNMSVNMDRGRKSSYWSDPCEMFARGFEVLVMDSMKARGRHNDMLVHGISDAEGQALIASGKSFPYPTGTDRVATCEAMAAVVRAYRNQFKQASLASPLQYGAK